MGESFDTLMERIQRYQKLSLENKLGDVIAQSEDPKAYVQEIIDTYDVARQRGYGEMSHGLRILSMEDMHVILTARKVYDP